MCVCVPSLSRSLKSSIDESMPEFVRQRSTMELILRHDGSGDLLSVDGPRTAA